MGKKKYSFMDYYNSLNNNKQDVCESVCVFVCEYSEGHR